MSMANSTSPEREFPYMLTTSEYDAVLTWAEDAMRASHLSRYPRDADPAVFLEDGVRRLMRKNLKLTDDAKTATQLGEFIEQLKKAFLPVEMSERRRVITSMCVWRCPAEPHGALAAFMSRNERFKRIGEALKLTEAQMIEFYIACTQGRLEELSRRERESYDPAALKLQNLIDFAEQQLQADCRVAAAGSLFGRTGGERNREDRKGHERRSRRYDDDEDAGGGGNRGNEDRRACRDGERRPLKDGGRSWKPRTHLPRDVYEQRKEENRCFECGANDHYGRECPQRKVAAATTAAAAPSAVAGTASFHSRRSSESGSRAVAPAETETYPIRDTVLHRQKVLKEQSQPRVTRPMHMLESTGTHAPRAGGRSRSHSRSRSRSRNRSCSHGQHQSHNRHQRHRSSSCDEGAEINVLITEALVDNTIDGRVPQQMDEIGWLARKRRKHPELCYGISMGTAPNKSNICFQLDGGSTDGLISRSYAHALGATVQSCPPTQCSAAGGYIYPTESCFLDVRLVDNGPVQTARFFVTDKGPNSDRYAIVPATRNIFHRIERRPGDFTRISYVGTPGGLGGTQAVETEPDMELRGDEAELLDPMVPRLKDENPAEPRMSRVAAEAVAEAVVAMAEPHPIGETQPLIAESPPGNATREMSEAVLSSNVPAQVASVSPVACSDAPPAAQDEDRLTGARPIVEILREVHIAERLNPEERQKVEALVREFAATFGYANACPAKLPVLRTQLKPGAKPVLEQPARLPPKKRAFLRRWLEGMVRAGIYRRCDNNRWASRVLLVSKGDTYRPCGNYVKVNECVECVAGAMADARQKMTTFKGCRFFALFDMENGYLQGELDETGQMVYAIITGDGVYTPSSVPFGVKNAPVWFHGAIARIVSNVPGCESIFDDVCIGAATFDEFLVRLRRFFEVCVRTTLSLRRRRPASANRKYAS